MSDQIRTALEGGGTINIRIKLNAYGKMDLCVTESWARQTGVQSSEIQSHVLDALDDPDGFIQGEITALFNKHLNWKAIAPAEEPEPAAEIVHDPEQDALTELMNAPCIPRRLERPIQVKRIAPRPVLTPAEELVEKIRSGLRVSLLPLDSKPGEPGGVQVMMECINPWYAAGQLMNRFLPREKLVEAEDPVELVGQTVYELSERMYGPVGGGVA